MNTDNHRLRLDEQLSLELAAACRLREVLEAEYQAIINRDPEALEQSIASKQTGIVQLEALGQERVSLIKSLGFGTGHADIENCLSIQDSSGRLAELWRRLLATAEECRAHNLRNHHLVEIRSRHTRQLLCILRGEDADHHVYSPSGSQGELHDSRSLGRV